MASLPTSHNQAENLAHTPTLAVSPLQDEFFRVATNSAHSVAQIQQLLAQGAEINCVDQHGRGALTRAVMARNTKSPQSVDSKSQNIKALLQAGADIHSPDATGMSALDHSRSRHKEDLELLHSHQSDKSKLALVCCSVFLGPTGLDRLYAGRYGLALLKFVPFAATATALQDAVGGIVRARAWLNWDIDYLLAVYNPRDLMDPSSQLGNLETIASLPSFAVAALLVLSVPWAGMCFVDPCLAILGRMKDDKGLQITSKRYKRSAETALPTLPARIMLERWSERSPEPELTHVATVQEQQTKTTVALGEEHEAKEGAQQEDTLGREGKGNE